jgi:hypothetical protein
MSELIHNFSPSCERNQQAIFEALSPWLQQVNSVLEIGSGSGQHAFHFCKQLPSLAWQCTDRGEYLAGLKANIDQHNYRQPSSKFSQAIELDVGGAWPEQHCDMIYTANSLHIMSWQSVQSLILNLSSCLNDGGFFCCYGPFKYAGEFTSPSNANFDIWLKDRNQESGIRNFEALEGLANAQQLQLVRDIKMPANNQLLIWQKVSL